MINAYMKNVGNLKDVKLLSREEERTATPEELVLANLRFVVSEAHKFRGRGLPLNDLVQEGNIGLIEAANKFDSSKGYKFITYAVHYIKMRMRRAIASNNSPVKVSDAHVEKLSSIKKSIERLTDKYGREPTVEEISEDSGFSTKAISSAYKYEIKGQFSLDKPIKEDGGNTMENFISDESGPAADDDFVKKDFKGYLDKMIGTLTPDEAYVIRMRFYENKTLDKTGQGLGGISPASVKAIQERALGKLKGIIEV